MIMWIFKTNNKATNENSKIKNVNSKWMWKRVNGAIVYVGVFYGQVQKK